MQPHGSWGQKQGPTVPDQKRPTPENPSQTRPISIRTNRHTPVQSIPQVRDIHVGSYRPHECLVIVSSIFYSRIPYFSRINFQYSFSILYGLKPISVLVWSIFSKLLIS